LKLTTEVLVVEPVVDYEAVKVVVVLQLLAVM
jgi:hypothetical protein